MYPTFLRPGYLEHFTINGDPIEVPKCIITFNKWKGDPVKETFGGKPIVSIDDKPMFAELAIVNHFIKEGWQSRWVETYGRSNMLPFHLSDWKDDKYVNQVHNPITDDKILRMLDGIAKENGNSYAGCWDVLAWKKDKVIFAESKRTKKDKISTTQINWLSAGLNYGLHPGNFLIVQWDL